MPDSLKTIFIKKDRAQQITKNRHPWVFSKGILKTPSEKNIIPGEIVKVSVMHEEENVNEKTIGYAAYNPLSEIRLRMITWNNNIDIYPDEKYFQKIFLSTAHRKEKLLNIATHPEENKNYRLIHAESDGIPGLIVDRYGKIFVIQCQTYFADRYRDWWVKIISQVFNPDTIYDKSDTCLNPRIQEGIKEDFPKSGKLLYGKELPSDIEINQDGFRIKIDIKDGQKTGYYLDLRKARHLLEKYVSTLGLKSVLNLFGYTGTFNLYAARGGAKKILQIESSARANQIALENAKLNHITTLEVQTADVFEYLNSDGKHKSTYETFDCIILDPPPLARTAKNKEHALKALTDLNAAAIELLKEGGILFTFSCSSHIKEEDFSKMIFKTTELLRNNSPYIKIIILEKITQDIDHTVIPVFPEGKYLNGAVIQKISQPI